MEQADRPVMPYSPGTTIQAEDSPAEQAGRHLGDSVKTADATVVVITHSTQRWPFLETAVENILSLTDAPRQLVICVDHSEELYELVKKRWPQVTVRLNTGERGASGTRNAGARCAETPFIAFVDDDISVREGWLARLLAPFADPAVVGTGGGVAANWETRRPNWFPEEFDWVVAASYRGMPTVQSAVRNVWSENMAVRAEVFNAVGGFREDFGKVGNRNSPEDTDLCIRMAASVPGATWVYAPDALVSHHVPVGRTAFSYFLRRTYLEGRGKVEMARLLGRQEKLKDEQDYMRKTLPSGIFAGLWETARHGRVSGFLKAGAITAGIIAAAVGAADGILRPAK
jgi:GT2 family glycosyltransferase